MDPLRSCLAPALTAGEALARPVLARPILLPVLALPVLVLSVLVSTSTGQAANAAPTATPLEAAQWEKRWITPIDPNVCTTAPGQSTRFNDPLVEHGLQVDGGTVDLSVDAATGRTVGRWTLKRVNAPWGWIHLLPPSGFELTTVFANGTPVGVKGDEGHLAIPLDACGRKACEIDLRFTWEAGAAAGWARARDVLPRLGLDEDRLLRSPTQRQAHGLLATPTLPEYAAATVVAGVAPAGPWQWSIRLTATDGPGGESADPAAIDPAVIDAATIDAAATDAPSTVDRYDGRTHGALDFSFAWPGRQMADPDQPSAAIDRLIQADVDAMRTCVSDRSGLAVALRQLRWQAAGPSGAGPAATTRLPDPLEDSAAHLADGVLSLAPALAGDRPARLAAAARAFALRSIADGGRLRETRAGQWLAHGLPGALALLCATGELGADDAADLLQRVSDRVTERMSLAGDEVGAIAWARYRGWVADYAPLSALDTVRRLTPAGIRTMVEASGSGVRPAYAMANTLGADRAALVLGMPLATDLVAGEDEVHSRRWRWQQGQWKPLGRHGWQGRQDRHWQLDILPEPDGPANLPILLDAWPAYERKVADNRHRPLH